VVDVTTVSTSLGTATLTGGYRFRVEST
jgi:hypothetical protein